MLYVKSYAPPRCAARQDEEAKPLGMVLETRRVLLAVPYVELVESSSTSAEQHLGPAVSDSSEWGSYPNDQPFICCRKKEGKQNGALLLNMGEYLYRHSTAENTTDGSGKTDEG